MNSDIRDTHDLLSQELKHQLEFETRNSLQLRLLNLNNNDYDAIVAVLEFIGTKPNGIALSGEIISFLSAKPYSISNTRISDLLKHLTTNRFVFISSTPVNRSHPLGNLRIQLESMRDHSNTTIQ